MSDKSNIESGYTVIPNTLLLDTGVTDTELRVWAVLKMHDFAEKGTGKRKGKVWPSWARLAAYTGKCRMTIYNTLKALEAKGYVKKLRGGGGRNVSNQYRLMDDGAVYDPVQKGTEGYTLSENGTDSYLKRVQETLQKGTENCTRNTIKKHRKETGEVCNKTQEEALASSLEGYEAKAVDGAFDGAYTGEDILLAIYNVGAKVDGVRYSPDATPLLYVVDDTGEKARFVLTPAQAERIGAILREVS